MDELIFALLSAMAEILAEVFLEVSLEAIVATIFRSIRNLVAESNAISPVLATAVYLLLGTGFGVLSIFLLSPCAHPPIQIPRRQPRSKSRPHWFDNVPGGPRASPEGQGFGSN
jgi:hypothetical protein